MNSLLAWYILPLILIVAVNCLIPLLSRSRGVIMALLGLVTILGLYHQYLYKTDAEDAYIAYRYVQNFVEGNGITFNPGEKVEGYSDFLWVVLVAAVNKISGLDIPTVGRGLSVFFGVVSLVVSYFIGRRINNNDPVAGILTMLLLAACGSFACYGPSGLETTLSVFLTMLVFWAAYKERWLASGVLIALSGMAHPDGVILFMPVVFLVFKASNPATSRWKSAWLVVLGVIILSIPWTAWRLYYYGHLLPNSVVAKSGMHPGYQIQLGLNYVGEFAWAHMGLMACVLSLLVMWFKKRKSLTPSLLQDRAVLMLLSIIIIQSAFVVMVGGDWMPAWRFIASYMAVICLVIVRIWTLLYEGTVWNMPQPKVLAFSVIAYFTYMASLGHGNMLHRVDLWNAQVDGLRSIGKWLNETVPTETTIGVYANGALSYYNRLYTIDMLGLTDEHIGRYGKKKRFGVPGHLAHDYDYVMKRRPDIIAFLQGAGFNEGICFTKQEMLDVGEFYTPVAFVWVRSTNPLGKVVNLWLRKDKKHELIGYLSAQPDKKLIYQKMDESDKLTP